MACVAVPDRSVVGDLESPCPSCPKAEAVWRAWFDGDADVPLAGLRDRLVADGWTADRYVGYFQELAKAHAKTSDSCCGTCHGDAKECPHKGDGQECPSKGDSKECSPKGDCPHSCPHESETAPEPETTNAE